MDPVHDPRAAFVVHLQRLGPYPVVVIVVTIAVLILGAGLLLRTRRRRGSYEERLESLERSRRRTPRWRR